MITINLKGLLGIWKEPRQPLSWRHGVLFLYWFITIIPAIVFIAVSTLFEVCGEFLDVTYGKVKRWANPKAYISKDLLPPPKLNASWPNEGFDIRDYLNADRDSITQPPPTR